MEDIIINLCPTGMIPTKEMTPHVPIEPQEIIEDVLRCAEIGITMVHLHARDKDGVPTYDPDIYGEILTGIRKYRPDLIAGISLSGRNFKEFEQRSAGLHLTGDAKPDTGSLTTSSLNFNKTASVNSPEMVKNLASLMLEKGVLPEIEIFDSGMLNYAKYLADKGILKGPFYANLLFGSIANAQANMLDVGVCLNQLMPDTHWSMAGIGRYQLKMNALSLVLGGGVRVGIEDNIWYDDKRTVLATNEMLVKRVRDIGESLGRKIMSPLELRKKLRMEDEPGKYGVKQDTAA